MTRTVVFIHPSDEMYGSDRSLLTLVRVSAAVCRPVVFLPDDIHYEGRLSDALRADGVEVVRGPIPVMRRDYLRPAAVSKWAIRSLLGGLWTWRELRRRHPDLVVSNTAAVPGGPLLAWLLGVRHVWYLREIVTSPRWFRALVRWLAQLPQGVVATNSEAVARWIGPLRRPRLVMHNAIQVEDQLAPLPDVPTAAFIGRMTRGKGWDLFVESAARVHAHLPSSRFVLAGGLAPGASLSAGNVRRVLSEVDPTDEWLTWIGETHEPREVLRNAWVAVVPSRTPEGLGNVVIEAMAEGRAVIGTNIGGIPEMVNDGRSGVLVRPDDSDGLAQAMETLLADRGLVERMGEAGRDLAANYFSNDRLRQEWLRLLAGLLQLPKKHRR